MVDIYEATIDWLNPKLAYGYATVTGGGSIFVHLSDCGLVIPAKGDVIHCEIVTEPRGPRARNVEIVSAPRPAALVGRQQGRVTQWKGTSLYGFIQSDCGGREIFAHLNDFKSGIAPVIDQRVEFTMRYEPRGPHAYEIEFI